MGSVMDIQMGLQARNGLQALIQILAYPPRTTCVQNETLFTECPGPITLCPGQGEEVSVPCDYPGAFDKYDKYFCKEEGKFQCKEILSKNMSIKFRTNKDYGIYWCGFNHSSNIVLIQKVSIQSEC